MSVYSVGFWKDAGERAVATAVQVFAGLFTVDTILNLGSLDVKAVGAAIVSAALLSLAKSLVAGLTGVKGSASMTNSVEPVKTPVERVQEIGPVIAAEVQSQVEASVAEVQARLDAARRDAEAVAGGVVGQVQGAVAEVQRQAEGLADVVREQLSRLGR